MLFDTKRLYVRPLQLSDYLSFYELQSDPEVMLYTGSKPQNSTECKADLTRLISSYQNKDNTLFVWAVIAKQTDKFIGTCALVYSSTLCKEAELGFRLIKKYWNRGYGREIAEGLIKYGFEIIGCERLFAEVDKSNTSSVKILEHFLDYKGEFFNANENCYDIQYELNLKNYEKRSY